MRRIRLHVGLALALALLVSGCATNRAPATAPAVPRYAEYSMPEIPPALSVAPEIRKRHLEAWNRLQSGDRRGADREFSGILEEAPGFYPAAAGLGYVQLAGKQLRNADPSFAAALQANARYMPALTGHAEALLGLGRDAEAIAVMERVLAIDPARETIRTRLELVRFRLTQSLIESGQRARADNRLDEARRHLQEALEMSPSTTIIVHELMLVESAAGRHGEAEAHARRAIELEPREARWHAALAEILEAQGKDREAATAYARAVAIDPRPEWTARGEELRERAVLAALPPEFARLSSASTITRGDAAAFVGIRLEGLVQRAPRRAAGLATDIRTHWAASWIVPVTQAGIMTIYANHTFQPGSTVRRNDMASIAAALVRIAAAGRPDLAQWQAARPRFIDVPTGNVFYRSVALAVASGVMAADDEGRFSPTRPLTGTELDSVVRRIDALATR